MHELGQTLFVVLYIGLSASCTLNTKASDPADNLSTATPERTNTFIFFSRMYELTRDTEQTAYDFMYRVRDGIDGFVYDIKKDYTDRRRP